MKETCVRLTFVFSGQGEEAGSYPTAYTLLCVPTCEHSQDPPFTTEGGSERSPIRMVSTPGASPSHRRRDKFNVCYTRRRAAARPITRVGVRPGQPAAPSGHPAGPLPAAAREHPSCRPSTVPGVSRGEREGATSASPGRTHYRASAPRFLLRAALSRHALAPEAADDNNKHRRRLRQDSPALRSRPGPALPLPARRLSAPGRCDR